MIVHYSITELPQFNNAVVTIGTFDGVHEGHQAILRKVVKRANIVDGESILLTFEPHPRKVLFPGQPLKLITPLKEKLQLISQTGIAHVVVVPFDMQFASLGAKEYIEDFLVRYFNPHTIVIGYDHRFGSDRKGNIDLLKQYQSAFGYEVSEIPAQQIDEATISSTKIRHALNDGQVKDAKRMLGHPHIVSGHVVAGDQFGRTIGYPTANIQLDDADTLIPANGVYAIRCAIAGREYSGMLNIGYRPTVTEQKALRIEANLFEFDEDIYGSAISVAFIERLRDEQKFRSIEELKAQLAKDRAAAVQVLQP